MNITIHTDASFNNSIAAFAFCIETPDGIVRFASLIDQPVDTPSMAELIGFQRAYAYLTEMYPNTVFDLTVYCDNLWVVRGLTGDIRKYENTRKLHIAEMKSTMRDLRAHNITTEHVKAHTRRLTTRQAIENNWCDFNSRELVRREISKRNES